MYSWLYSLLPGTTLTKLSISFIVFLGVLALLFFVVFPAITPLVIPDPAAN